MSEIIDGVLCGTLAGFRGHLDRGEVSCWSCREAGRVHHRADVLAMLDAELGDDE